MPCEDDVEIVTATEELAAFFREELRDALPNLEVTVDPEVRARRIRISSYCDGDHALEILGDYADLTDEPSESDDLSVDLQVTLNEEHLEGDGRRALQRYRKAQTLARRNARKREKKARAAAKRGRESS